MRQDQKLPKHGRVDRRLLVTLDGGAPTKGRAATTNATGRFEALELEAFDDGWGGLGLDPPSPIETSLTRDSARQIVTYNTSPDIPFDRSINPYRGCEHGCIFCFARPTHAYLGHSAGLDFETKLYFKDNAVALLKKELAHRRYDPKPVTLGINTDAYQPIERRLGLTRKLLEVLVAHRHPVMLLTKSALILRDLDLITALAADDLVSVGVTITTLDPKLSRALEPRAAAPHRRLQTVARLAEAGLPVRVMMAPIIPALTEAEIESLLEAAKAHGASHAGYVLLRLPYELKDLFHEWLKTHYPDRALRVINTLREMRGGKDYDAAFGVRGRGKGHRANLIARRFARACSRLGLNQGPRPKLRADLFQRPDGGDGQLGFEF